MAYIDDIMRAHPEWPRQIKHGEYAGVLSGVQPLLAGEEAPIYRFPGGECVGVDYEVAAVRFPVKKGVTGIAYCGFCDTELSGNQGVDMPEVCPACHEGVDWSAWREV
ncbi:hypothetical protein [Clostridium sp. D33t1_170424_F3]|uniref:hypothetical protein n=1 Tax=Clostridium sp. D33t1_170424_F3 TaxID=2787099 RepID=UPI0018AB8C7D|nr:hypothetical protein [Clostridium sp. D33t1_170424_F3]